MQNLINSIASSVVDNLTGVLMSLSGIALHFITINIPMPQLGHYVLAQVCGMIVILSFAEGSNRKFLMPRVIVFGIILGFFLSQSTGRLIGLTAPEDIQLMGFAYGAFGYHGFAFFVKNRAIFADALLKRIGGGK